MKQLFYLAFFGVLIAMTSCTSPYTKGDAGIEYKIIADGSGKKLVYGNFMQLHISQSYKGSKTDTLLGNSRDYMPRTEAFDSSSTPPAYLKILTNLRIGDSVVFRILADSVYKQAPGDMPPFMKKEGYLYTTVKILNIFETREQADSANIAETKMAMPKIFKKQMDNIDKELVKYKAQIETDSKLISAYLEKNNIKTIKGKWGTFIAIQNEGTGSNLDFNSVASVNYTGKTLDSMKVFDSNTDLKFGHLEPYPVSIGQLRGVIMGWFDALLQMKKGTKATVYIPSSLGYGKNGNPPKINPDANLIFDMEVVGVSSEEEMMAQNAALKRREEQSRKHMMDSILNAQKK